MMFLSLLDVDVSLSRKAVAEGECFLGLAFIPREMEGWTGRSVSKFCVVFVEVPFSTNLEIEPFFVRFIFPILYVKPVSQL